MCRVRWQACDSQDASRAQSADRTACGRPSSGAGQWPFRGWSHEPCAASAKLPFVAFHWTRMDANEQACPIRVQYTGENSQRRRCTEMYGLSVASRAWLDISGRQNTLKAPSHGENRGSSPLGSAKKSII